MDRQGSKQQDATNVINSTKTVPKEQKSDPRSKGGLPW